MNCKLKNSIENCAIAIINKIEENKLASYRQKLLSAVVAKNHKRILDVLTQLSVYSETHFNFVFDYMENQTENEDIIHYFILQLVPNNKNKKNEDKE